MWCRWYIGVDCVVIDGSSDGDAGSTIGGGGGGGGHVNVVCGPAVAC